MPEHRLWNASLSTMWAIDNFASLEDFCATARRLGFAGIELNHQIDSAMLAGLDQNSYRISSVHEPCPADIPVNELKSRDWMISAPEEENRIQGVAAIYRSIDLAHTLGVRTIVVHAGNVRAICPIEKQVYALYRSGEAGSSNYAQLKGQLIAVRAAEIGPRLEAVHKSLAELLEYAGRFGIQLGLENRFHYMDIPTPGEMAQLLTLAGPEQLGFWYDVGHAQVLDRLGFFPHQEWLQQFGRRMVGVHLHDVAGIADHGIPGTGEVDFAQIAPHLPPDAIRTLEVKPSMPAEKVQQSLSFLAHYGIIQRW